MKKIILPITVLFFSFGLMAQNTKTATANFVTAYKLSKIQEAKLDKIQANKEKNLSEIEKYKATNPALYLRKRQAISEGANASISRMLTPEQSKTFKTRQTDIRLARAKKAKELKGETMSDTEKELILLELEDQF